MPSGSLIIGVDLLPIRAIPKVKTFVEDITTPVSDSRRLKCVFSSNTTAATATITITVI